MCEAGSNMLGVGKDRACSLTAMRLRVLRLRRRPAKATRIAFTALRRLSRIFEKGVGEAQKAQPEAFNTLYMHEAKEHAIPPGGPFAGRLLNIRALQALDEETRQLERAREFLLNAGFKIPSFWEWDEALNTELFCP